MSASLEVTIYHLFLIYLIEDIEDLYKIMQICCIQWIF